MKKNTKVNAAILIIGNEILSGRTQDTNTSTLAIWLNSLGVQVNEVRVIPDTKKTIIENLNVLRKNNDYVFTTGGIGPTHDDITAESVSEAFGLKYEIHPEAFKILETSLSISEPISWYCLFKVNGGICIVNILTLNHISMGKKKF